MARYLIEVEEGNRDRFLETFVIKGSYLTLSHNDSVHGYPTTEIVKVIKVTRLIPVTGPGTD